MTPAVNIDEIWSLRVNPSDLSNIERPVGVGPATGGGQLYVQIGKTMVQPTLDFLRIKYPAGSPVNVPVRCWGKNAALVENVEFSDKSQGRMRITNQNRHRANRVFAWSPSNGFPQLSGSASTADAKALIAKLGGLHIWIVRDDTGELWAGYSKGAAPPADQAHQPFAHMLYGSHPGGHWKYVPKSGTP